MRPSLAVEPRLNLTKGVGAPDAAQSVCLMSGCPLAYNHSIARAGCAWYVNTTHIEPLVTIRSVSF